MPRFGKIKEVDENPEKRLHINVNEKLSDDVDLVNGKLPEFDDDDDFELKENIEKKEDTRLPESHDDMDFMLADEIKAQIESLAKEGKTPEADKKRKELLKKLEDMGKNKKREENIEI